MESEITGSLHKFIAILDSFSIETPALGVREAARRTGMSSSAAGRIMQAMRDLGVLNQDIKTLQYSLGSRVLTWSGVYSATLDIRNISLPSLQKLHRETQETISLYVLEGNERVCVERIESSQNVRIVARVGRRLPLYAGSAGKVFLAFMPEDRRDEILSSIELVALTPKTITNPEVLINELEAIRMQGFAVSSGEWLLDAAGVATPIFDQNNEIAAVLTISGPAQRFTSEKIREYSQTASQVAREISSEMGCRSCK
jgi:DNA-binding IclR family transcriptional regulator